MPITNRGKFRTLRALAHDEAWPAFFRVVLVSDVPTPDTKTMSELSEIAAGNGYTSGGVQITRDVTGFPAVVEDDADNLASAQIKDVPIAASGGTIPASGGAINYGVLIDDNATLADAEIWAYSYVLQDTIANGETLTLANWLLQLLEAFMSGVSNAANIGAGGVGLFKVKNGDVLEFRNINVASPRISLTLDDPNNEVDIDAVEAAIDHDALLNYVIGQHRVINDGVATTINLWSGDKIQTEVDRAFHQDEDGEIAALPEKATPAAGDYVVINDGADGDSLAKVDVDNFLGAGANVATGSYTGNGAATRAITGLGFQPTYVRVYKIAPSGFIAADKSDQDGANALLMNSAATTYTTDHVISLNADGFTVGDGTGSTNQMNINTAIYAFVAVGG